MSEQIYQPSMPVAGYKPQGQSKVDLVNHNKNLEEIALRQLDALKADSTVDQRWLAIGRTAMEQAWMAVNRAVFQPGRVALPEDNKE